MGLVGIKGMVGKNDIRIERCHADINSRHNVRGKGNVLGGKVQNLNVFNTQNMKGIHTFNHSQFVAALHFSFFVGIAGFAHDQHLDGVSGLDCLGQSTAAGNFNIIKMCANC